MNDIIVSIIIITILTAAIAKIVIEKRKGAKCVGCSCSHTDDSSCGCNGSKQ
jgi:hypothetical protein